jgi:tRNA G18 (ribose-2'-O)-methylase SpoU
MRHAVDDPADPRLADFKAEDPRQRRREVEQATRDAGYLVVEGAFAVRRLIGSGRPVRAVLVDATQHTALADVLDGLDAPVYLGSRQLIEATLGYAFHRGAIASAARDDGLEPAALLAGATRLAMLEGIGDLENLGSIFRNAAAFGVEGVLPGLLRPFAGGLKLLQLGRAAFAAMIADVLLVTEGTFAADRETGRFDLYV